MAAKKKTLPPELDPIFPIVAGYEIPPIEQGHGKQVMEATDPVTVTMPYRSFYFLWEYAERQGAKQYPKYVGGPLDHAAQTWLDAVYAMRSANYSNSVIRRFPEGKAQKARSIRSRMLKKAAETARAAKAAKNKTQEGATEAQEPRSGGGASSGTRKTRSKAQRASKSPARRKPSKRKASK